MSGAEQLQDATLPITLPLSVCGLGEAADAAEAGSALADASSAADDATDNIDDFSLSAKHLAGAGGNYAKFSDGVVPKEAIEEARPSPDAKFYPNPQIPNSFRVVADPGTAVGTRGQTAVQVIVTDSGRIYQPRTPLRVSALDLQFAFQKPHCEVSEIGSVAELLAHLVATFSLYVGGKAIYVEEELSLPRTSGFSSTLVEAA